MASLQKNVASQNMTFLMISTSTGLGVAGLTVSVFVTKDNGAQGSGAGTVTNLGNGQYNYAPTQSETNATDVGFLFTATGAVPVNLDFHTDVVDANGYPGINLVDISGSAVSTSTAQLGVNCVQWAGTAINAASIPVATAAGAAGGLLISGTNTGPMSISGGVTFSNSTGDALALTSSGSNGNGLNASGNGTGAGILTTGGATGNGLKTVGGATSGDAILTSTVSGHGATFAGSGTAKHGINATGAAASGGNAAGNGISATGGAASTSSGGTSGAAILATGGAGAASTNGSAAGLKAIAGGTVTVSGNDGAVFTGTGNGNGLTGAHAGTGLDLNCTTSPPLQVNATQINGVSTSSVTTINANQGTTQPINFTGTGAGALVQSDTRDFLGHAVVLDANNLPEVDIQDISGSAVSTSSAQLGVNVVNIAGQAAALDGNNLLKVDVEDWHAQAVTLDSNNAPNVSTKYWAGTLIVASSIPVATAAGAAGGLFISGANTGPLSVSSGVSFTGLAASGATPATAGLTLTGGAASTTSGGTSSPGMSCVGGAGAASTNGSAAGLTSKAGGTVTVAGNDGAIFTGTGNGNGLTGAHAGTGLDLNCTTSPPLQVNATQINGVSTSPVTTINANQGTTQPVNFTGTGGSALVQSDTRDFLGHAVVLDANNLPEVDVQDISGSAVSTSTAQLGVNVVQYNAQTAQTDVNNLPKVDVEDIRGTLSTGAAGYVGIDWAHINAPTTTVDLSGTTIKNLDNSPPGTLTTAQIATAVLTDTISGDLSTSGSIGYILAHQLAGAFTTASSSIYTVASLANAPGGSGSDPWATFVPGSYAAGQAGYILGNFLDAKISSRMAQTTFPQNFASLQITPSGHIAYVDNTQQLVTVNTFAPPNPPVPPIWNIKMKVGEDKQIQDFVYAEDGQTPQDMTGWVVTFVVHAYGDPSSVIFSKTSASPSGTILLNNPAVGIATIPIVNADTLGLFPNQYEFYLTRTDTANNTEVTKGLFTLSKL
jgi:hypothetical protein